MKWLQDFQKLSQNLIYSIDRIEWWLLKYSDLYISSYDFIYSQHLVVLEDGSTGRFPPCGKPPEQEEFLNLYQALETIAQFHKNEKYFKEQMALFEDVKDDESKLKDWIKNNEEIGSNQYACFLLDYLDYDENDIVEHLNIYVLSAEHLEIYVDRKDFKHTIEFLNTFNELYWI